MDFKLVAAIALLVVVTSATPIEYHHEQDYHHEHVPALVQAPVHHVVAAPAPIHHVAELKHIEHEAPVKYDFAYGVHDEHTGDIKSQKESNDNGNVHGSYSLIDADGYKRTVEYTADDHNGFNAVVHREPLGHKVHHAEPVQKVIAAPLVQYDHHHH